MNKILLFILVLLTIGFGGSVFVQACDGDGICEDGENCQNCPDDCHLCNPLGYTTFGELVVRITNLIFNFALILAPLLLIVAGFYFTTAGGDPGRINTAKDIAKFTIIGLTIILLARALIEMIQSVLGVT